MRIDTSEPSLTALFNKGQVGLIRTEFMRKDDVIAGLRAENTALWGEKDALAAENERLKVEVKRLTTALKTADRVIKPLRDAAAKKEGSK